MICLKHKTYKGIIKPRVDCLDCWRVWIEKSSNYQSICQEIDKRKQYVDININSDKNNIVNLLIEEKNKYDIKNKN